MTSGLPQVRKLWFVVSKGMLPVQHLAPEILIDVDYCEHQLGRWLVWMASAYRKMEGASLHHGVRKHGLMEDATPYFSACRHRLQFYRRLDWCFLT